MERPGHANEVDALAATGERDAAARPSRRNLPSGFAARKAYLTLTDEDAARLRSVWPCIEADLETIVAEFYRHLLSFEETAAILADKETVQRLEAVQKSYLAEMFSGTYGAAYCQRKVQIGQAHHRIGLGQGWYLGAYHLYQRLLFPRIVAHLSREGASEKEIVAALLSLTKVMTLDMELALEAYFEAYHEALIRDKERLEMLTARLQDANTALNDLTDQLEATVEERTSALLASEERLQQTEKLAAIGKMASLMAHEVRNPLTSVILNLELLSDELESYAQTDTSEARSLVDRVLSEVNRMNTTIRDYLAIARTPQVRTAPAELNPVIQGQMAFLEAELEQAGIALHMALEEPLPPVMLDREQFRQVLLNLVKNSLDAMPDGGTLEVSTELNDDHVRVRVHDSGTGIASDELERIFQPLYTTKQKGLGMGLAFVREVIHAHGGTIVCESKEKRGTTFIIDLPVSKTD